MNKIKLGDFKICLLNDLSRFEYTRFEMDYNLIDETLITTVKKLFMLLNKPAKDLVNDERLIFKGNFGKEVVLLVDNVKIVLETVL